RDPAIESYLTLTAWPHAWRNEVVMNVKDQPVWWLDPRAVAHLRMVILGNSEMPGWNDGMRLGKQRKDR
ncbi:MAG: hypothetical protein WBE26_17460, partial [Phycisphaerae bacterium]